MRESTVLGIGVAVVSMLVLLSAVHVYWALGGQLGKGAVLPERNGQPVCQPGAAATVVVAIALLGAAVVLALRLACSAISSAGRPCTGLAGWSPQLFSCEASGTSGGWVSFAENGELASPTGMPGFTRHWLSPWGLVPGPSRGAPPNPQKCSRQADQRGAPRGRHH